MKCTVCDRPCGWGALSIAVINDEIYSVNLCQSCRHTLLGVEVDERVRRLVRLRGWVQPRIPGL